MIDALSAVTGGQSPTASKDQAIGKQDFKAAGHSVGTARPNEPTGRNRVRGTTCDLHESRALINIEEGLNNVAMTSLATNNTSRPTSLANKFSSRRREDRAHIR